MVGKPNVLVIVLDTVRADVVTPHTPERVTPFLARLAEEALVFERAFTTSDWTLPAHASMLTGQHGSVHGINNNVGYGNLRGRPTLASRMGDEGYATWGLSNNPWFSGTTSLDEGFDRFELLRPRERRLLVPVNFFKDRVYENFARAPPTLRKRLLLAYEWLVKGRIDDGCGQAFRRLLQMVDGRGSGPWFAMVNVVEAHGPYVPPQPFRGRFAGDVPLARLVGINQDAFSYHFGRVGMSPDDFSVLLRLYKAEVAYLDHMLEALFGSLRRRGALDDTLVVITSDHGENVGDHGLMEHRWCLYETLLHVPLVLRPPQGWEDVASGADPGGLAQLLDLMPTLGRFAGFQVDRGEGVQGIDLTSDRRDRVLAEMVPRQLPRGSVQRHLWERFAAVKVAAREEDRKVIWSSDGAHELYDLAADPGEVRNLYDAEEDPGVAPMEEMASIGEALSAHRDAVAGEADVATRRMRDRLRALGYLS